MAFSPEKAYQIGEQIGIDWDAVEFDSEALAAGMMVELEHGSKNKATNVTGDNPEKTAKIAWVHLLESPIYYSLLAEMEEQFVGAVQRTAYQIEKPMQRPKGRPPLSPELKQRVQQYIQQMEQAIEGGVSADDAFKQLPSLDDLTPDDLINLLWENQHIGGIGSMIKLAPMLPALDIYDIIQKLLERDVWVNAVWWWGEQKTEKAKRETEKQKATERDETETVVQRPQRKGSVGAFWFRGYQYKEQK